MAGSCLRLFYALAVIAGLFIGGNEAVCISRTYRPTTSYQYVRKYAYANNEDCNFYFLPYSSYSSSLYFLEIQWYYNPAFSVKGEMPNCARDYVEVFLTGSYKSIGRYCSNNIGSYTPHTMYSHDGRAKIKFHSDSSGTGSGFQLRFRLRSKSSSSAGSYSYPYCYNTYQSSRSGIVYSSGWPRGYKKSTSSCTHKIYTGSNRETKLVFMDLDLSYYGSLSICSTSDDSV